MENRHRLEAVKSHMQHLPAVKVQLCLAVREAYIAARRNFDKKSEKSSTYYPSVGEECVTPTPYERLANETLKHGLNPLHFIFEELDYWFEGQFSSDPPRINQLKNYARHDPHRLAQTYSEVANNAIKSAEPTLLLAYDSYVIGAPGATLTEFIEANALNNELFIDPVYMLTALYEHQLNISPRLVISAYIAYLTAPTTYKLALGTKRFPKSLANAPTFEDWQVICHPDRAK